MSLYGEYQEGLLTDSEYTRACEYEAAEWNEDDIFTEDDIDDFD